MNIDETHLVKPGTTTIECGFPFKVAKYNGSIMNVTCKECIKLFNASQLEPGSAKVTTLRFIKFEKEIGRCSSCQFAFSDGDHGEIACCDQDWFNDMPYVENLGIDIRCPLWRGNHVFCERHDELTLNDMCGKCIDEMVKEQEEKGEL